MPNPTIDQVRQTLQELDQFKPNEEFLETSPRTTVSLVDGELLQRYVSLRDDYLKKEIERGVVEEAQTFDGENFSDSALRLQEVERMRENICNRRQELWRELPETAKKAQASWDQLQADYARLEQRKEDLRRMLAEYQGDGDSLDLGTDEEVESVQDEDLEAEQERLITLQNRKKELLSKIHRLQDEYREVELQNSETEANTSILSYDDETIAEIEKENDELRKKIADNEEIAGYFETMRLVTEEMSGIRVLSVDEGNAANGVDVVMTLEILHEHQVEIGLLADKFKKNCLGVFSATLLTPPKIVMEDENDRTKTIELPIPALNDLVSLAQPLPRPKGLAFVIQETVSRIEMIQERAEELFRLISNKNYRMHHNRPATNNYGRCDHEVSFIIPEHNVKVFVLMTPDCPRVPGSVYLEKITSRVASLIASIMNTNLTALDFCYFPKTRLRKVKKNPVKWIMAKELIVAK